MFLRALFSTIRPLSTCFSRSLGRSFGSLAAERRERLLEVYAPFSKLDKNSPEYKALAISGRVWEDHHQPGDSEKQGYVRLEGEQAGALAEIDSLKESMKLPVSSLAKCLVSEYALQSVQIEDNRLQLGDSIKIYDFLASSFSQSDLSTMSSQDLYQADIPEVNFLLPDADASQVTELRNHIMASQWIAETASQQPETPGLDEDDIRHLSAVTIKGTTSEALYTRGWGDRVKLGGYRSTPISARSNPLCIFPYHVEVPALVKRFFEWRDRVHNTKSLHPLISACQITAYFLHIHPFPDGNGRVSRMLMQDYLVRQGYLPIVMQSLDRKDYLRMIIEAQQGEPDAFVNRVVTTELEEMQTFKTREW